MFSLRTSRPVRAQCGARNCRQQCAIFVGSGRASTRCWSCRDQEPGPVLRSGAYDRGRLTSCTSAIFNDTAALSRSGLRARLGEPGAVCDKRSNPRSNPTDVGLLGQRPQLQGLGVWSRTNDPVEPIWRAVTCGWKRMNEGREPVSRGIDVWIQPRDSVEAVRPSRLRDQ
jgi:hypothetical protein